MNTPLSAVTTAYTVKAASGTLSLDLNDASATLKSATTSGGTDVKDTFSFSNNTLTVSDLADAERYTLEFEAGGTGYAGTVEITITADGIAPTATLTTPGASAVTELTITFNEAVSNTTAKLGVNDLIDTISDNNDVSATATNVEWSDGNKTLTITVDNVTFTGSNLTVKFKTGVVKDAVGNVASDTVSIEISVL